MNFNISRFPFSVSTKVQLFFLWIFFLFQNWAVAQIGGQDSFAFLNVPSDARLTALGGINISAEPSDVNSIFSNPALVDSSAERRLSFNFTPFYAGISNTNLAFLYGKKWGGNLGFGVQYLSYGKFDGYDISANSTGEFSASDFALMGSYSYEFKPFRAGVNLKIVGSSLGDYSAGGIFFDFGGAFIHPKKELRIGLVIKNLGFAFTNYTPNSEFSMPLDVQAGFTYKFDKMPLRLSVTAHQIQGGDISFDNPNRQGTLDAFGNEIKEEISKADRFSRHFVLAGELIFHPRFNLRFGYNFLTRKELVLTDRPALVGFSFGGMLKVKNTEIAIARSIRNIAGGYTCFSVILDTRKVLKKRKKTVIE